MLLVASSSRSRRGGGRVKRKRKRGTDGPVNGMRQEKRRTCDVQQWWKTYVTWQSPRDFKVRHRMPESYLIKLGDILYDYYNAQPSSQRKMKRERMYIQLACTLRYLGGSQVYDLTQVFHVGKTTVYRWTYFITGLINKALPIPPFPVDDREKLAEIEMGFAKRSKLRGARASCCCYYYYYHSC